jgi:guanylate kinase
LNEAVSVIVVSAPSGAGKSTLMGHVLRQVPSLRFSISHTTRAPRTGEQDGVQYHFVSRPEFERLIREEQLLEWAEVHGNYYGTGLQEYEGARVDAADLLLDLDVQGAALVRRRFPDAVTIFVLPPSYQDLERRLRGRGQDGDQVVARRLMNAHEELSRYSEYDFVVVNDDLERCASEVVAIVTAARRRRSRMESIARQVLSTFESHKGGQ